MLSVWTRHLKDPKDIEQFKLSVLSAKPVLERIQEIMKEEVAALDRSETNPENYNNPSWAYLQAHKNGYRQFYQIFSKITNLDPKDNK